jgi:pimeloyl-ACP methyl ester carboxylesterase
MGAVLLAYPLSVAMLAAAPEPQQRGQVQANGITIAYESRGQADRETILLIAGTAMQLTAWPDELLGELVKRGYRVIVYDNRDVGLSTKMDAAGMPDFEAVVKARLSGQPAPLSYTLYDMARDAVGLLDALGVKKAHVAGVSMGGMIAQIVATDHPKHTLSLTSIMATDGKPGLPIVAKPERLASVPPPGGADDKSAYIARQVKVYQALAGPDHPPAEADLRERVNREVERSFCPLCEARQAAAALFTAMEDRRARLNGLEVPTVVLHGADDPIVPVEAGRDVAENVPGADLRIVPGMGHDIPAALAKVVADAITAAASRRPGR